VKTVIIAAAVAILALWTGYATRPFVDWVIPQGGAKVQCVADGKVCVGAPVSAAFGYRIDDHIGGVLAVDCGPSDRVADKHMTAHDLMSRDCAEPQYLIAFSNGRRLTNVWVDQGKIVRLDDYTRHTIDP